MLLITVPYPYTEFPSSGGVPRSGGVGSGTALKSFPRKANTFLRNPYNLLPKRYNFPQKLYNLLPKPYSFPWKLFNFLPKPYNFLTKPFYFPRKPCSFPPKLYNFPGKPGIFPPKLFNFLSKRRRLRARGFSLLWKILYFLVKHISRP